VNQDRESGLPYDIVITEHGFREYVKVKEAMAPDKKGFRHIIQTWKWQFLSEKGDSSSIAHISFPSPDEAAIVMLRNPRMLCKKGQGQGLALVMSKEFKECFTENMSKISVVLKPDCYLTGTNWRFFLSVHMKSPRILNRYLKKYRNSKNSHKNRNIWQSIGQL
jgi:hypothetical protein